MPKFRRPKKIDCHACIEAKMKHRPKPRRSILILVAPGQIISVDIVGPFKVKSLKGSIYAVAFIDHYTNTPFLYGMASKSEYPKYLRKFLLDFRELFNDGCKVHIVRVLRSDNAQELHSSEVQQIEEELKLVDSSRILMNNSRMVRPRNVLVTVGQSLGHKCYSAVELHPKPSGKIQ